MKAPDSASRTCSSSAPKQEARNNGAANGRSARLDGGSLGDALRNLQRYTQRESFDNQGGGGGQFGPEIQFDTKGVEFGPWIRRFIAQVKRNWFIPYAAMSMKGHVVVTFNVHKDGSITDLQVVGAVPGRRVQQRRVRRAVELESHRSRCRRSIRPSKAFFTVTFFYNETPPR